MTIVDFSGTLQVVQNFTASADLLKAAVWGQEFCRRSQCSGAHRAGFGWASSGHRRAAGLHWTVAVFFRVQRGSSVWRQDLVKFGIALPSSTLFDILDQSRFSTDAFERELLDEATCPIALCVWRTGVGLCGSQRACFSVFGCSATPRSLSCMRQSTGTRHQIQPCRSMSSQV